MRIVPQERRVGPKAHHLIRFLETQLQIERLTRGDLAKATGYCEGTLDWWWSGRRTPNLKQMEDLLNYFGFTLKPGALEDANRKYIKNKTNRSASRDAPDIQRS